MSLIPWQIDGEPVEVATDWRDYGYKTPGTQYVFTYGAWHRKRPDLNDPQENRPERFPRSHVRNVHANLDRDVR
jgi:hypothetical protein